VLGPLPKGKIGDGIAGRVGLQIGFLAGKQFQCAFVGAVGGQP
jgi:hypothetical protein